MRIWMKNALPILAIATLLAAQPAAAADDTASAGRVTFTKDVLPILQENCQTCHRPLGLNSSGMIAPMSFMNYKEVRPWAKAMARMVETREMPPWHASAEHNGVFENERTLTGAEIDTLVRWSKTGATMGRPEDAPEPLVFGKTGWSFGEPDLILEIEPYLVADDVQDQYANLTVTIPLEHERYIQALEFKPGSEAVHHIIAYASGAGAQGQGRGRAGRGMVGGMAPGNDPDSYPEGYGVPLPPKGTFVFAMHYHKEPGPGTAVMDHTKVGLKLYDKDADVSYVHIEAIGAQGWEIPPNHPYWEVGSSRTLDRDIILMSFMPHMHLRGRAAKYVAFYPDGTQETLLWVPEYDFNWQTTYNYKEFKRIPAGTRLENTMWFANDTARGERAGVNPERPIRFGGPTTDEMDLGWLSYIYADEAGTQ